jgi:outer membrane protein insertion porin family
LKVTAFLLIGLLAAGVVLPVHAQDYSGRTITEVRIEGLARVSEQAVRSQIEVQPGQEFNSRAVARDIRRMYDLGFFSNIIAEGVPSGASDLVVVYRVEEKMYIAELRVTGASKIKERNVRAVLSWREGDSFAREAWASEQDAILRLYQSKGFVNAKVDLVVEEIGVSRVRVTYVIHEGQKARIHKVQFEGNDTLTSRTLRKLMQTRRSWWIFAGKYDENVFEMDLDRIVDEYGNHGRLEAEIDRTDFNYSPGGKRVDVTIHVAEGPEYTVESLATAGNYVYDNDEVEALLKVQAGDVHNRGQVEADARLVQQGYEDSGYINANVTPQVTVDGDAKTTHVVHRVTEGDLKYIREIKISGNTVTRDDVIRREMLIVPGERFDGSMIRASQNRLDNLEYFDATRFTLDNIPDNDEFANLLLDVDEGKTGYFNFGAGYSSEEKFGGYTELRFDNFDIANWPKFSGGGQQFRIRLHLGQVRNQYNLSFTDPEILGYPFAFGFDVYNESYDYSGGANYSEDKSGVQLRVGKILSPYVSTRAMLRYADTKVTGLPWYAWLTEPQPYLDQAGGTTTASVVLGITRNTQDSNRDATRGARHELAVELAGLGGDNYFYKVEHDSTWFFPLDEQRKWILSYRTREGWVNNYGSSDSVPIQDRFFAGGTSTVRGYDNRDIGPKETGWLGTTTLGQILGWDEYQAVGGEVRVLQSLEMKYKITEKVRVYSFVDGGGVWSSMGDFDLGDMKWGAGLGFGVEVPRMGPIRLDYGIPINPDDDQGSGKLHLQTGFRF